MEIRHVATAAVAVPAVALSGRRGRLTVISLLARRLEVLNLRRPTNSSVIPTMPLTLMTFLPALWPWRRNKAMVTTSDALGSESGIRIAQFHVAFAELAAAAAAEKRGDGRGVSAVFGTS
mmetsp:Transcript_17112/g.31162  ORF Transcript_17112/g.31162 Transcript_17112/m.31162 type:complete len:120 (+) Transcript_17112:1446-1805(+)